MQINKQPLTEAEYREFDKTYLATSPGRPEQAASYHPPFRQISLAPNPLNSASGEYPPIFVVEETGPYDPGLLVRPRSHYRLDSFEEVIAAYAEPLAD